MAESAADNEADSPAFSLLLAIVEGRLPQDWVREWLEDWLGPRDRATLLLCNKACSEWVLQTAEEATCALLSYSGTSADLCAQRAAVASRNLATRGKLTTRLVVHQPSANQAALTAMAEQLSQDSLRGVAAVELRNHEPYPTAVCTAWLRAVSHSFVNLTSLSVHNLTGTLPPPSTVPKLRDLSLCVAHAELPHHAQGSVWQSVAAFVTQITTLSLSCTQGSDHVPWDTVLAAPSTTLTSLTTADTLTDSLVQLILDSAPSSRHIAPGDIRLHSDWQAKGVWAVNRVTVPLPHQGPLVAEELCALPGIQIQTGKVTLTAGTAGHVMMVFSVAGPQVRTQECIPSTCTHPSALMHTHTHTHTHTLCLCIFICACNPADTTQALSR